MLLTGSTGSGLRRARHDSEGLASQRREGMKYCTQLRFCQGNEGNRGKKNHKVASICKGAVEPGHWLVVVYDCSC